MKFIEAYASKGCRVTVGTGIWRGTPKYTGILLRLTKIHRAWGGVVACEDGEERFYRIRGMKCLPGTEKK